jgi:opacity protein-like surface antigen
MRRLRVSVVLSSLLLACSSTSASAEWLFTPYAGLNWGGTARFNDAIQFYDDEFKPRMAFGGAVTWTTGSALSFEFDFGFLPQFFADRTADDFFEWGDSRVMTFMGNVNYSPISFKGMRPYASGGAGLINTRIKDPLDAYTVTSSDFGVNAGGGVTFPITDTLAIRGDARYFRILQENLPAQTEDVALGKFYFWRTTVGLTLRF